MRLAYRPGCQWGCMYRGWLYRLLQNLSTGQSPARGQRSMIWPSASTINIFHLTECSFTMNGNSLAPCTTLRLPNTPPSIISESALVFCVQVNFIEGGLMHIALTQHTVMDMTGPDFALNMLSKNIQKGVISEDLTIGTMNLSLAMWLATGKFLSGLELIQLVKPGQVPMRLRIPLYPFNWTGWKNA